MNKKEYLPIDEQKALNKDGFGQVAMNVDYLKAVDIEEEHTEAGYITMMKDDGNGKFNVYAKQPKATKAKIGEMTNDDLEKMAKEIDIKCQDTERNMFNKELSDYLKNVEMLEQIGFRKVKEGLTPEQALEFGNECKKFKKRFVRLYSPGTDKQSCELYLKD